MSSYKRLKLADLRVLGTANGIEVAGLTKSQLIEQLTYLDEQIANGDNVSEDNGETSGEEVVDSDGVVTLSPELKALTLQLELAKQRKEIVAAEIAAERERLEIEKERSKLRAGNGVVSAVVPSEIKGMLPSMQGDDVIGFFNAFERVLEMYEVDSGLWAKLLAPHLSQKATRVYSRLSLEQCKCYETVKEHILLSYKCSSTMYLDKFRSASRSGQESYSLFSNRLRDLLRFYLDSKSITQFDALVEDLIFIQFLDSLDKVPDVKKFVLERNPANVKAACEFADLFYDVSKSKFGHTTAADRLQTIQPGFQQRSSAGYARNNIPFSSGYAQTQRGGHQSQTRSQGQRFGSGNFKVPLCHICGGSHPTHLHQEKVGPRQNSVNFVDEQNYANNEFVVPTFINDTYVTAIRDTGADICVVDATLVRDSDYTSENITLYPAFGASYDARIAIVDFKSPALGINEKIRVRTAVVDGLRKVLLGNNLFRDNTQFQDWERPTGYRPSKQVSNETVGEQKGHRKGHGSRPIQDADGCTPSSVVPDSRCTAIRDKYKTADNLGIIKPMTSASRRMKVISDSESMRVQTDEEWAAAIETCRRLTGSFSKSGSTRHVRCTDKPNEDEAKTLGAVSTGDKCQCSAVETRSGRTPPGETVTASERGRSQESGIDDRQTPDEFTRLSAINVADNKLETNGQINGNALALAQTSDASLQHWFQLCKSGDNRFCMHNGILYKTAPDWKLDTRNKLLVLPESYRPEVIRAAHDSPSGAHQGARKVIERIDKVFAFPGMSKQVRSYIRSCHTCQLVSDKRKGDRVPLTPIPIVGNAFEELICDVIGKLTRTSGGHEYIFVIVCQATRWVHAVPLRNLKVTTIADTLNNFFMTHGYAKKLRFDKFASFTSGVMKELQKILQIECIFAPVDHHESIGTVERQIRSLERMLKSFIDTHEKQWDKLLPYFCFAINDTANATTHFAPSYLVYGRRWRGLLDVMRDAWITDEQNAPTTQMPVYTYIEQLKQRLKMANEAAQDFARTEQARYKQQYDKHSRERSFVEGDLVLIMRPTSSHKILSKLDGPYRVIKKLDRWNYVVDLGHRHASFHINSLREYVQREAAVNIIIATESDEAGNEFDFPQTMSVDNDSAGSIKIGPQLTAEQRRDVEKLVEEFPDVFTTKLGLTHLVEHVIKVTDETPISRPAYKVPHTIADRLDDEITRLLQENVIAPSDTAWTAGVVPVIKADKSIRVTCDWRALNSRTVADEYPMPNPADILSLAATGRWLSKIDIKQAFFQVPMARDSEKYTGFRTQSGLWTFKRCAMGLKNSPKTMQRLLDSILRGCHKFARTHIDDIIISSAGSWTEHLSHVREVLTRLRNAGLTVNVSKCEIAMSEMCVLGHTIANGKIGVDDRKVESIKQLKYPTTKKELRMALGLLGYYMKMVPNYAEIAAPLTDCLKKEKPEKLNLTSELKTSFDRLKAALVSKPVLCPANLSKDYILQTDASNHAVAGILSQINDEGQECVISYASRKLLPREQNYSTIQKELLAIVWSTKVFENWIYGRKVFVQSDHKPLSWLNSLCNQNSRLMRWSLYLQRFDLVCSYKRGVNNNNVDTLTRL